MKYSTYTKQIIAGIAFSLFIVLGSYGQNENQKMSTLFGGDEKHISHGGWAGLNFGYTKVNDYDTYLFGARGGWLINHRFTLGLAGCAMFNDKEYTDIVPFENVSLSGGYGGLFMEAVLWPFSPVHLTIPVTIGAGGIGYTSNYWSGDYENDLYTYDSDAYFLLEPGLEIELNLVRFMRFALGGSYRYTSEIDLIGTDKKALRGFNGHCTLKFGWF